MPAGLIVSSELEWQSPQGACSASALHASRAWRIAARERPGGDGSDSRVAAPTGVAGTVSSAVPPKRHRRPSATEDSEELPSEEVRGRHSGAEDSVSCLLPRCCHGPGQLSVHCRLDRRSRWKLELPSGSSPCSVQSRPQCCAGSSVPQPPPEEVLPPPWPPASMLRVLHVSLLSVLPRVSSVLQKG